MDVLFQKKNHRLVFTEHARIQMDLRGLSETMVKFIIETGIVRPKDKKNKFWIFKKLKNRSDNLISISVSVESPNLIVITTMVNWRPE